MKFKYSPAWESAISVTGTTVVDFRDVTIDLTEINTVIETASIEVYMTFLCS